MHLSLSVEKANEKLFLWVNEKFPASSRFCLRQNRGRLFEYRWFLCSQVINNYVLLAQKLNFWAKDWNFFEDHNFCLSCSKIALKRMFLTGERLIKVCFTFYLNLYPALFCFLCCWSYLRVVYFELSITSRF